MEALGCNLNKILFYFKFYSNYLQGRQLPERRKKWGEIYGI